MAITAIGESQSFDYTGGIQTFTVPFSGLYKLEVRGARGGYAYDIGYGTYGKTAIGYIKLKKGEQLFVVCGGIGGTANTPWSSTDEDLANNQGTRIIKGGYNGGGNGQTRYDNNYLSARAGGGGGATHIARTSGLLADIPDDDIIIIASGGAGQAHSTDARVSDTDISKTYTLASNTIATNDIQGQGSDGTAAGAYTNPSKGGGGGGYRGGLAGYCGRCFIDRTPEITIKGVTYSPETGTATENNGSAIITYVTKISSFGFVGAKEIVGMALGDTDAGGWKVG